MLCHCGVHYFFQLGIILFCKTEQKPALWLDASPQQKSFDARTHATGLSECDLRHL